MIVFLFFFFGVCRGCDAKMKRLVLLVVVVAVFGWVNSTDRPCAARSIEGQSVVCVCNSTYCDDITREEPANGTYYVYTSSKAGLRFNKTNGTLDDYVTTDSYSVKIELNPNVTYQTIKGFGGAVSDAAGINWKNVSEAVQENLINSYCSSSGLEYNILRVPIGGSDFSTHAYAYNMYPENDTELTNFTLTVEDTDYKIPMINACMSVATDDIHVIATTWSPPTWMKTTDSYSGFSRLEEEYYQTYANYHLKFIEAYNTSGIPIWAITTTNEPFNGVIPFLQFNSLGWTPGHMAQYIDENLGPTIRNSTFNETKILALDDQRLMIPFWFNHMVKKRPSALQWIDGVAVHWYMDFFTPASLLDTIYEDHPDKFVIASEACEGSNPWQLTKVKLGSWKRAESYVRSITSDLTHHLVGWIDWNLALNPGGGPNWAENFVDSPIIVYSEADEFIKQPMFYAMGHFSKFVPRGSKRIDISISGWHVECVAFTTPSNTTVAVLRNKSHSAKTVKLVIGSQQILITTPAKSFNTVELLQE